MSAEYPAQYLEGLRLFNAEDFFESHEVLEELWSETETVSPTAHEAILLLTRPPIDAPWLEEELDALRGLVEAGETLELVGRLHSLVGAPRRAASTPARPATVEAVQATETA